MSDLPPAVPPFQPDVDTAYAELGKAMAYIKQLTRVLQERAIEANQLDDERLEAIHRAEQLGRDLDQERERNRQLMAQISDMRDDHMDAMRHALGSD
jgi:hypothetical protein